jgi:hypothetical protein
MGTKKIRALGKNNSNLKIPVLTLPGRGYAALLRVVSCWNMKVNISQSRRLDP